MISGDTINMAGLSKFVMRNREHFALLMADEKVLYLAQMRFHDEQRQPDELKIPDISPSHEELDMAMKIIASMSAPFQPEKYQDTYQDNLMATVQTKLENKEVSVPQIEAQESAVQDLMEQLRKSLEMTG